MKLYASRDFLKRADQVVRPQYGLHQQKPNVIGTKHASWNKVGNQFIVGLDAELFEQMFGFTLEPGTSAEFEISVSEMRLL